MKNPYFVTSCYKLLQIVTTIVTSIVTALSYWFSIN